jgi:hypothetical protein
MESADAAATAITTDFMAISSQMLGSRIRVHGDRLKTTQLSFPGAVILIFGQNRRPRQPRR